MVPLDGFYESAKLNLFPMWSLSVHSPEPLIRLVSMALARELRFHVYSVVSKICQTGRRAALDRERTNHSDFESGHETNRLSGVVGAALNVDRYDVAQKIKSTVIPLLDSDRKDLLVPSLFDIIASDTVIDNEKSGSFQKYVGQIKAPCFCREKFPCLNC